MNRAPFQVLVLPYLILSSEQIVYAVFRRERSTGGYWQGIAGGGTIGETPLEAARREASEEAGLDPNSEFRRLDSYAMIPVVDVCGFEWGEDLLVIPEYCFGARVNTEQVKLSDEHLEYKWVSYDEAFKMLHWDSNKSALWELNYRLHRELGISA